MNITKIAHCCLLIKLNGLTILTDPGTFSTAQDELTGIDIILITHEHADHLHAVSVMNVLSKNPKAEVIGNGAVAAILKDAGVACTVVEGRQSVERAGIAIEAFDGKHGEIFNEIGQVQNTAYYLDGSFFIPGDSFEAIPEKPIDVLALPVAGPWCKMPDAIRYAIALKPKQAFPIHDAMLKPESAAGMGGMLGKILAEQGIAFVPLAEGESKQF